MIHPFSQGDTPQVKQQVNCLWRRSFTGAGKLLCGLLLFDDSPIFIDILLVCILAHM